MVIKYSAQWSDSREQNEYTYELIPMDEDVSHVAVSW